MRLFYLLIGLCLVGVSVRSYAPPDPDQIDSIATPAGRAVFFSAIAIAQREGAPEVTAEHFLKALLRGYHPREDEQTGEMAQIRQHRDLIRETVGGMFAKAQIEYDENTVQRKMLAAFPKPSTAAASTTTGAAFADLTDSFQSVAREFGQKKIWVPHILIALMREEGQVGQFLKSVGASDTLERVYSAAMSGSDAADENSLFQLDKYGKELVQLAREGKVHPAIGRDVEISKLVKILSLKQKPNAMMRGEPGVGKTQIVEGLAYVLAHDPESLPQVLRDAKIYAIDLGALIGGAKFQGQFEERLKSILKEASESSGLTILFIDEAHVLAKLGGAQGGADALNLIKPPLSRGELHCIFATTRDEYTKYLEADGALERRVQILDVDPSTVADTIEILKGIQDRYAQHHGVAYSSQALESSARMADRHVHDKQLPDKAINPIDKAGAMLSMEHAGFKPDEITELEKTLRGLNGELVLLDGDDPSSQKRRATLQDEIDRVQDELRGWQTAFSETQAVLPNIMELDNTLSRLSPFLASIAPDGSSPIGEEFSGELARHGLSVTSNTVEAEAYRAVVEEMKSLNTEVKRLNDSIEPHRKKYGLGYVDVQPIHIARAIAEMTGKPLDIIATRDNERYLRAAELIGSKVLYQDHAVRAVSNQFMMRAQGMGNPNQPIGSFIFLGPTGVGKTLLAKTVARYLFGDPEALVQLNMSDYPNHQLAVSALLGATASYVGFGEKAGQGKLTEPVRQNPYRVVLLDEIDKAPAELFTILLTMQDDGFLTDSHGRKVDFRNTLLIMNGNCTKAQLENKFKPENLGRLSGIVEFNTIDIEKMKGVASTVYEEHRTRLLDAGVDTVLSEAALNELARIADTDELGIRRLNNAIEQSILIPLAWAKARGTLHLDQTVEIDFKDGKFTFGGFCAEQLEQIAS